MRVLVYEFGFAIVGLQLLELLPRTMRLQPQSNAKSVKYFYHNKK